MNAALRACWPVTIAICTVWATPAATADPSMSITRERVIELARKRAPAVRIAETRVEESRGKLVGARVLLPENPALEVMAGPRWANGRTTDIEALLAVPIQLGGRRDKRIAVANAAVDRDTQLARDAQRTTVGVALAAYYRTLAAKGRVELGQARKVLADDLLKTANERRRAGDVAQLEVNLATAEVARAESEILSAEAGLTRARAELAVGLGLGAGDAFAVDGKLDDRTPFDAVLATRQVAERPDLRAARAEVVGTRSDVALADASRFPDLSFRVGYKREDEGTDIVLGGFAISLPFFERNQGPRAESRARRARAAVELDALQSAVAIEVEATRAAYQTAVASVQRLAEKGLPLAMQNEDMARESYRVGKIDLATLLLVRREALDTRREHLERQLEAALAGVDLTVAVGVMP